VSDDDARREGAGRRDEAARGEGAGRGGAAAGDEAARSDEAAGDRGGAAETDDERRREAVERMKQLRVADLVEVMLVDLVTVGYQKLGLTDQTRELRDLDDARLAIETLRAWIDVVARERGEEGLADLRGTVAAMQLSYARAVEAFAAPVGEAPEARPDEGPAAG